MQTTAAGNELTNENLPVLERASNFVRTSHLRHAHSSHDEDDETRAALKWRRTVFLVPLAIAGTTHTTHLAG